MHVLVSGATGFLGSWVVGELLSHGHRVTALVRPGSDAWRLAEYGEKVATIAAAMDDHDRLRTVVTAARPDAVAHLAWRGVDNKARNDASQAANIFDTLNFLDIAASAGARVFVGAGSQAEYGPYGRAIRENDAPRPTTLYGHAKLACFHMGGAFAGQRGIRFCWLRVFSAYGPKDSARWLIPNLIRSLRAGERMPLTACEQRWGFIHARDVALAFRIALENDSAAGAFNVGSSDAPLLRDTVEWLRDRIAPGAELGIGELPYREDQVMVLQADVSRLMALGWRPAFDFPTGLQELVAWHNDRT
jgi:UDP-glucose 4-epimerase